MDRRKDVISSLVIIAFVWVLQLLYFRYLELNLDAMRNPHFYFMLIICLLITQYRRKINSYFEGPAFSRFYFPWVTLGLVACFYFWSLVPKIDFRNYVPLTASDQDHYITMFKHLLAGSFSADQYYYGLGYPGLAYLANFVYPKDPFAVVNMISYSITIVSCGVITRILTGSLAIGLVSSIFLGANYFIILSMKTFLWTSTPVLACYSLTIAITLSKNRNFWAMVALGLVMGLAFATRYVDVLLFIPIWIYFLWEAWKGILRRTHFITGASVAALLAIAVFVSHHHYFGDFLTTPYDIHHARPDGGTDGNTSTYARNIGVPMFIHLFGTLIDPKSASWDWQVGDLSDKVIPLFAQNFMMLFGILGLLYYFQKLKKSDAIKPSLVAITIGMILFLFVYSLHPGSYPGCLRFGSAHYFKPLVPLLFPMGIVFFSMVFQKSISFKSAATSLAITAAAITILSCAATYSTPRQFQITLATNTITPSEPLKYEIQLKNRFGTPIPDSAYGDFQPHAVVKALFKDGKSQEYRLTPTLLTKNDGTYWIGSFEFKGKERQMIIGGEISSYRGPPSVFKRKPGDQSDSKYSF